MTASGTAIEMAAQRGRAAVLDGVEHTQVVPRKPGTVLLDEAVLVLADEHSRRKSSRPLARSLARLMASVAATSVAVYPCATINLCGSRREGSGIRRVFNLAMTEQHLDGAQISAGFEQVRGITVP